MTFCLRDNRDIEQLRHPNFSILEPDKYDSVDSNSYTQGHYNPSGPLGDKLGKKGHAESRKDRKRKTDCGSLS